MVAIPTNYKMGTGLAATIMGQQAGLEAEQTGLENLFKAGQVPTQMLEGAKAMDLLNNPEYMKATQQWQTTAAQGRVSEEQSKKAYNDLTLLTTQLQAYNGDLNKQRSILMESFQRNGVPIDSPMAQTLLQKPLENTMVARDQVAATLSKTPTHMGEMEKQRFIEGEHWKRTQAEIQGRAQNTAIQAGQVDRREAREIARAQRAFLLQDPTKIITAVDAGLNNNIDPVTLEPLTPEKRKYYENIRNSAKAAAADKSKSVTVVAQDGTKITIGGGGAQTTPAPATASKTGQSEAEKAGY